MREPNPEKLNELVGKLVNDLGVSLAGASILLGDRLGLYKAMADGRPVTPSDLAKKTKLHERYVREWMSGQAASGYIDYDSEKDAFSLSPEQAMAFAQGRIACVFCRRIRRGPVDLSRRTKGRRSLQDRKRGWLARAFKMSFPGHRTFFQTGL